MFSKNAQRRFRESRASEKRIRALGTQVRYLRDRELRQRLDRLNDREPLSSCRLYSRPKNCSCKQTGGGSFSTVQLTTHDEFRLVGVNAQQS